MIEVSYGSNVCVFEDLQKYFKPKPKEKQMHLFHIVKYVLPSLF